MANMTCQNQDFATINGYKSNNILHINMKSHTQMKIINTKALGGKNVISTNSRWLPNPALNRGKNREKFVFLPFFNLIHLS